MSGYWRNCSSRSQVATWIGTIHQRPEHSPVEDDETAAVMTWETEQEDSGDGVNPTIKNKRKLEDERDNVKKSRCQEETQAVESLPAPPPPPPPPPRHQGGRWHCPLQCLMCSL